MSSQKQSLSTPTPIYLKDYTPAPYMAEHIYLTFQIHDGKTHVHALTRYCLNNDAHNADAGTAADLVLNGELLKLVSCTLNGRIIHPKCSDKTLVISGADIEPFLHSDEAGFNLEIVTEICPENNTRLEGLYKSGDIYCTQCEAEGFRTITYYQDRPDVMAPFTVRIEADAKSCPVLLSNGNFVDGGALPDGRHYAIYDDPYPKPCYLFALVAGELVYREDIFTTMDKNDVHLRIYVHSGNENQVDHAMMSLKRAMRWDEDNYGRVYQYNRFDIVAVHDFNMGAMENTSLNIFNTALTLAHLETATDEDFRRVEAVIAHEYFHNWTGNRITCRDWFQLSLKEGLTVFREQQFCADMFSQDVQRIDDVTLLREKQFAEDASPLAHPVRPDEYIEINNFYTLTVYEKGSELIRMQHALLGTDVYRKATDLYFERHDGQAITCEDFVRCMEEASDLDLSQFWLWYIQSGTPELHMKASYDADARQYTLRFKQSIPPIPGQKNNKKAPMLIPVRVGLLGANGQDICEKTLHLNKTEQIFTFDNIQERPVPSVLRGFSAPVKLHTDITDDDLRFLMVHDSDGYNRWDSGQRYALRVLHKIMSDHECPNTQESLAGYSQSYGQIIDRALNNDVDKSLMARSLTLPGIVQIGQTQNVIDPDLIYATQEALRSRLLADHKDALLCLYKQNAENEANSQLSIDAAAMGRRSLKNTALHMLCSDKNQDHALFLKQIYDDAQCMTDRIAALKELVGIESDQTHSVLADFRKRYANYPLVINKWFSVQVQHVCDAIFERLEMLKNHSDFTLTNPNRVRALYGAFSLLNPVSFHHTSGKGYTFLKDGIVALNDINPQIASRLITPLREWRQYTVDRQDKMRDALTEIRNIDNISPDVYEVVQKCLEGER